MALEQDRVDHHGHYLTNGWVPPIRLHRAGREVQSSRRYRCLAARAGGEARLLVQRCEAGEGVVVVGGRRHLVTPGRALVVAIPGTAVWAWEGGAPWRFAFASVACPSPPDLAACPVIDLPDGSPLARVHAALVARRLAGDAGPQAALAYQLLLGVVALAAGTGGDSPEERLAAAIAACDGRCRIAALVRAQGGSHAALTRRFARRFGEPPRAWAERLRLRAACLRLAAAEPPGAAAEAAGWADPAHFGRAFRRRLGLTPGAWAALADALRPWP